VTLAAVVTPAFFVGTLTGDVTFFDGATVLSTTPLSFGRATFSASSLSPGPHSITAVYGGDLNYQGTTSVPVYQTILPPPVVNIGVSMQQPLNLNRAGNLVAHVTITNNGDVTVDSLQVTIAGTMVGSSAALSAPAAITNLAPGASVRVKLKFPPSAVSPTDTSAPLSVSGTYSATSWTLPLSGNWAVSFRSVSLP